MLQLALIHFHINISWHWLQDVGIHRESAKFKDATSNLLHANILFTCSNFTNLHAQTQGTLT